MVDDVNDISGLGLEDLTVVPNNNVKTDEEKAAEKLATDNKIKADADKAIADKIISDKAAADKLAEEAKLKGNSNTAPEAVEIDGVKYKLDDKGNALDDKGIIFKTKDELDTLEDANEPVVDVLIKRSGYVPLDDNGKPIQFEDTEDGIIKAALEIGKLSAKKERENLIKSDPEFEEFIEYKKRGGKLEDFANKKTNSWKAVKFDDNNETQLEDVILADLTATGMSDAQAKKTVQLYKDTKQLKEFGKEAHTRLVAFEERVETEEKLQFENQQKVLLEQQKTHWDSVKTIVTSGDLKGVKIPDADKDDFFKYVSLAVDEKGNSQRNLDRLKLPLEQLLQLDYYQFKGFDVSKLIQNAANGMRVKSLREKITKSQTGNKGNEGIDKTRHGKPGDFNISLDDLQM